MDRRPSLASFCADEKRGPYCAGLAAAIPLPQGIAPPVTEVPPSGLTKFLISRENELGLSGSPRGGPSEGRAGNQRDQREWAELLQNGRSCIDRFTGIQRVATQA